MAPGSNCGFLDSHPLPLPPSRAYPLSCPTWSLQMMLICRCLCSRRLGISPSQACCGPVEAVQRQVQRRHLILSAITTASSERSAGLSLELEPDDLYSKKPFVRTRAQLAGKTMLTPTLSPPKEYPNALQLGLPTRRQRFSRLVLPLDKEPEQRAR